MMEVHLQAEDPLSRVEGIVNWTNFVKENPSFKQFLMPLLEKLTADADEDVRINAKKSIQFLQGIETETFGEESLRGEVPELTYFCPRCGKQPNKNLMFCEFCGSELAAQMQGGNEDIPDNLKSNLEDRSARTTIKEKVSLRRNTSPYCCLIIAMIFTGYYILVSTDESWGYCPDCFAWLLVPMIIVWILTAIVLIDTFIMQEKQRTPSHLTSEVPIDEDNNREIQKDENPNQLR